MKIYEWQEGMSLEESKNEAYWERNMLALFFAVYINDLFEGEGYNPTCGWYYDTDNNWEKWKRVISIDKGKYCFHIPDDFDVGRLKQIEPDWDGHTTKEKWIKIMKDCDCKID
jgi:hypothetical protein